jgi:FkbM family methyltransferase
MIEYFKAISRSKIIPDNVLEIGSRDGHHAEAIRKKYGIHRVYVVEPNPHKALKIRENYPDFMLFEVAISDKNEIIDFYQIDTGDENIDGMSGTLDRPDLYSKVNHNKIKVNSITGKSLLSEINEEIDMCKIDVEGLTWQVLNGFGKEITKIKSFHIETEHNEIWKDQKIDTEVNELLTSYGYLKVNQSKHTTPFGLQYDQIWILQDYIN